MKTGFNIVHVQNSEQGEKSYFKQIIFLAYQIFYFIISMFNEQY